MKVFCCVNIQTFKVKTWKPMYKICNDVLQTQISVPNSTQHQTDIKYESMIQACICTYITTSYACSKSEQQSFPAIGSKHVQILGERDRKHSIHIFNFYFSLHPQKPQKLQSFPFRIPQFLHYFRIFFVPFPAQVIFLPVVLGI